MTGKFRAIFALLYLLAATACTQINYVTVDEISASLQPAPIVAGFDIDDTVLFSSPGFYYGQFNHDGADGSNKYGNPDSIWTSKAFWKDMNGKFDKFSMPKASGKALIRMHQQRGDTIVFITARNSSETSIVPEILHQVFDIAQPRVIFTNNSGKDPFIADAKVNIYYGDADSDMKAAIKAGARPVRILRSPLSTNKTSYQEVGKVVGKNGEHGEEVLKDSEN